MDKKQSLIHIGLSDHQANIFLALLRSGRMNIADLAKTTGLHRPTVYQTLPSLIELGLVSQAKKRARTIYLAESPERLSAILSKKAEELEALMPTLVDMQTPDIERPLVKFFEGKEGIRQVFSDVVDTLKRGEVFFRYSSAKESRDAYLPRGYRTKRDEKQLERFVITSEEQAKTKKPRMERAIKAVPKKYGLFNDDITQIIYTHKVAFIDYTSRTAVVIENKTLAEFQKRLFKILYDLL